MGTVVGEPDTASEGTGDAHGVRVQVWLGGTGDAVGVASLGRRLPASVADDLRFDPWHTGASLRPVGLLNRLRRPAYVASQRGRGAPGT